MDIYTTTIAISILVYIAIGNYAGRGVKKLDDYYVAGRRAPTFIIVGTLVIAASIVVGFFAFLILGSLLLIVAAVFVAEIGDVNRFENPKRLCSWAGLTPRHRESDTVAHRGSITKQGSKIARFILGQLVVHILKRDPKMRNWYRNIKRRRGSKIARVAVMRRLTTVFWMMVSYCTSCHILNKQGSLMLAVARSLFNSSLGSFQFRWVALTALPSVVA